MTLMFRPTPEQQASLPLGSNFEMTLSGVVQNSTVQVSLLRVCCSCQGCCHVLAFHVRGAEMQA